MNDREFGQSLTKQRLLIWMDRLVGPLGYEDGIEGYPKFDSAHQKAKAVVEEVIGVLRRECVGCEFWQGLADGIEKWWESVAYVEYRRNYEDGEEERVTWDNQEAEFLKDFSQLRDDVSWQ